MSNGPIDGEPGFEEDEEDWFGEGTAFDSGEDLAAALLGLAGVPVSTMGGVVMSDLEEAYEARPAALQTGAGPTIKVGEDAFQVLDRSTPGARPAAAPSEMSWTVRPQIPGTPRTSWGLRHSMKFLKTTEEVVKRLRNEATELTWEAAAIAIAQANPPRRARKR